VGVTEEYPTVRDWTLQSGDFFTASDLRLYAQVAVLGATTAEALFGDADPVGQTIQLRQVFGSGNARARILNFRVIGVLEAKGSTFGFSRDDQILVPTTTAQHVLTGRTNVVNAIIVKAASSDEMANTTEDVRTILLARHKISDPAAAPLPAGIPLSEFGPPVDRVTLLPHSLPLARGDEVVGVVLHVDRFGNAISNLRLRDLPPSPSFEIAGLEIATKIVWYYLHERVWAAIPWGRR